MSTKLRFLHRLLGLLLAAPLILWVGTGILFHVKYRYSEAYERLAVPAQPKSTSWRDAVLSPGELAARFNLDPDARISLWVHPFGKPVYGGIRSGNLVVVDSQDGSVVSPATEAEARRWVESAVAVSPHASRYGTSGPFIEGMQMSSVTGASHPAFAFEYSSEKRVTVDRYTGEMTQTGALNDWIDATYRAHYLQWTPWKPVNIALVLIAAPLALALALSGLWIFVKK